MLHFFQHYRSYFKRRGVSGGFTRAPKTGAGFTLIELLVVTVIIMILTGVFLFQQSRFDSATILRSLAYSTALSVRQAQVYGTSVLGTGSGDLAFAPAYGIYVTKSDMTQYILFADQSPANGRYDAAEKIKEFRLGTNYTISKFCARTTGGYHCSDNDVQSLQILFKRPNPDAQFLMTNNGGTAFSETYSSAYIQIQSGEGTYRTVWVSSTGQVSVLAPNTDPS